MIEQAKKHGIPWEIHFGKPNGGSLTSATSVVPQDDAPSPEAGAA